MSATADHLQDPELLATEWDLAPLVDGESEPASPPARRGAHRAHAFAERYAGTSPSSTPPACATAMHELAAINELVGKAGSYASLRFSTDTADPARGALLALVQERATEIETKLLFFELEWAALPDEHAERAARRPTSSTFCRHYLRSARRYRPHLLTEPEEKILAEKSISSQSAWARLFGELVSGAAGRPRRRARCSLDVALSRLQAPDRDARRAAAEAVTDALEPGLRTRAFIFNTLVHDKAVEDRLRHYPHWLASATSPTRPPTSR